MLVCVCEGGVVEAPVAAASQPATAEAPRTVVGKVKTKLCSVLAFDKSQAMSVETHECISRT